MFEPWLWSWLKVERSLIALQLDRYRSTKRFQSLCRWQRRWSIRMRRASSIGI